MIRRLFLVAAAVAWLVAPGGPEAREWKKIRIGVEGAYPPFSWINPQGKLEGFDIDIAYALCAKIGAECELVLQDWDGMIPALLAKKFDAIVASMSITEERKKKVDFTDKYYQTPARFVRKKGSGIEITREGLKGKKIGVQRATIHDNYLTDNYGDTVEIVRYGTQDEANLDMIAGRLDLLLAEFDRAPRRPVEDRKGQGLRVRRTRAARSQMVRRRCRDRRAQGRPGPQEALERGDQGDPRGWYL